jgi:hypothetical protein
MDPAERRAHMAEHLRDVLQLQPSQDGALNTYLDALKPPGRRDGAGPRGAGPGGAGTRGDREAMQHMTTPERLDRMAARMDERRTRMLGMIAATKQFYAQLTPAQQKAFDSLPLMMSHGGRGMGMGGPGKDGQGWGGHGRDGRGGDGRGGWDRDDGMGPGGAPRS